MLFKTKFLLFIAGLAILGACTNVPMQTLKVRQVVDTVGFAQYAWQLDSILARIPAADKPTDTSTDKMVICPHDDYAYAGSLYPQSLSGIKANTIVLIGVAHKARIFKLENKMVFGSFDAWKSANGIVKVSPLRNQLLTLLPKESFIVHDSMIQLEHSLEAILPFLQKKNPNIEIIPVLIPYFQFDKISTDAKELATALHKLIDKENLAFGKDLAIVISNDAIHYGDTDWGGSNMAPFGVDSLGTAKAYQKDQEIVNNCLIGKLNPVRIKKFYTYTVQDTNYKAYKWTWCGRYAVPFGLELGNTLNQQIFNQPLIGTLVDYRSSFHNAHLKVNDLQMGTTAPANQRHWVGYVGMRYK